MNTYKDVSGRTHEYEGNFYMVGTYDGVDGAVFTADMDLEEGPLFFIEKDKKNELVAALLESMGVDVKNDEYLQALLSVTSLELESVMDTRKEMIADGATMSCKDTTTDL